MAIEGPRDLAQGIIGQAKPERDASKEEKESLYFGASNQAIYLGNTLSGKLDNKPVEVAKKRTVTFWRDGLSVTFPDGEGIPEQFMGYQQSGTQSLMQSLHSGTAPHKEMHLKRGEKVEIRVVHKLEHDYKRGGEAEGGLPLFKGTPATLSQTAATKPVKQEQIPVVTGDIIHTFRLPDGSRHQAGFEANATVRHLYNHLHSHLGTGSFNLMHGHPPSVLEKSDKLLSELGYEKGSLFTIKKL